MEQSERTKPGPAVEPSSQQMDSNLKSGLVPDWRSWIRDLLFSLAIAAVVIVFLYQPVKVEGTSMMPRLTDQERVFINKFIYRFESIHRGDVVVFRLPADPGKSYIKRVIGLPGEVVNMTQGEVFIDRQALEEPYIMPEYRGRQNFGPVEVPPGEFFLLGDRRSSSNDSRSWGTVSKNLVYGKAVFVYWPIDRLSVLR